MRWRKTIAILGDSIIRVACLPEGIDEVPATFAVRQPGAFRPAPTRLIRGESVYTGDGLRVVLRDDGRRLSRNNLRIDWKRGTGRRTWKPGMKDRENLGGGFLSLDVLSESITARGVHAYDPMKGFNANVGSPAMVVHALRDEFLKRPGFTGDAGDCAWQEFQRLVKGQAPLRFKQWPTSILAALRRVRKFPPGLLSRSGATIFLDDSLPWNATEDWISQPPAVAPQVLYFVRYGSDYRRGLSLLTKVLGPPPAVPDWAFGIWFSCFEKWGEKAFGKLADDFRRHDLPLDVVVVDTDWHKLHWHGFDWNRRLFPQPKRFSTRLRRQGLHAAFNVHPAYIPEKDTRLPAFLRETGMPRKVLTEAEAPHPFMAGCHQVDLFDKQQAEAYFRIFHTPIEREGCDIWWVDGALQDNQKRDATPWLNEVYAQRESLLGRKTIAGAVPLVLSRSFGLGSHRSSLHFTGDTFSQWGVLEQEVAMTAIAGNSLMGYVSHDIGGFFKGDASWRDNKAPDDLFVRWVQFGCWSPIMRLHSDHGIREPWAYAAESLAIIRRFLKYRSETLAPLLRRLAREARHTGVGPCRPLYYQWPDDEAAYRARLQYMIGEKLLVAPVTRRDGRVRIYIPPGRWKALFHDKVVEGPCHLTRRVELAEMPVYTLCG